MASQRLLAATTLLLFAAGPSLAGNAAPQAAQARPVDAGMGTLSMALAGDHPSNALTAPAISDHAAKIMGDVNGPRGFLLPENEDCRPQQLLCGQSISSSITDRDCRAVGSDGVPYYGDIWAFPVLSPQAAAVGVRSNDFSTIVGIATGGGTILNAGGAPVGGFASTAAYLNGNGLYHVIVTSGIGSPVKTGSYSLLLLCDSSCHADAATACLVHKRYRVQVAWQNQFDGTSGFGRAVPQTDQATFFSFGDPANVELLVKVLDFGDAVKIFYGELTNLHFMVTVTDMVTNHSKTYTNTTGDCGGIDQNAFPATLLATSSTQGARAEAACRTSGPTLCLLGGRFVASVQWHNQYDQSSGIGAARQLSDFSGAFSFTDPSNLELVVKTINFGDRIAVFYGALSDLEYTLTVTDSLTGASKTYHNPPGRYCGGLDNAAFNP